MTRESLNSDEPFPTPLASTEPTHDQTDPTKTFVNARVLSLSNMIINMAKTGQKSHVIRIFRKNLITDISTGIQTNFPDSKVMVDEVASTITVDWS